jgi:lactate dehydrogenase-like 2-hydroxyacid dehydrogenase
MKPDVLVLAPTLAPQMDQLAAAYTLHRYDLADAPGRAQMLETIGPRCQAVVTNGHTDLNAAMIAQLPALKLVACVSAGYETIDVAALSAAGARLTNTSDALSDDVADTAILLMLAARRDLVRGHAYVQTGDWGRQGMYPLQSAIKGKKLGIVGMGKIGQAIVARAQALRLEVAYHSRSEKPELGLPFHADLQDLAVWADMLIVIVAGGPATRNLIDERIIRAVGPAGSIINVSRGSVVDETALKAALQDGGLASAGLDVFWDEPNPDPALTSLPNVTLYPHHASGTVETRAAMSQLVVDNLAAHYAGKPLLTPVN